MTYKFKSMFAVWMHNVAPTTISYLMRVIHINAISIFDQRKFKGGKVLI